MVRELDERKLISTIMLILKETGREGSTTTCRCTLGIQLWNLSLSDDSGGWFLTITVCFFSSCRARSLFYPKGCCMGKRFRVRGHCRAGHALVYGATIRDHGIIDEVSGSNSDLSDSPAFRNLLGSVGTYRGRRRNVNMRPGIKLPVELAWCLKRTYPKRRTACKENVRRIPANQRGRPVERSAGARN